MTATTNNTPSVSDTVTMEHRHDEPFVTLIDPVCSAGKLRIPLSLTEETRGRVDWKKAGGLLRKDLSLCCLFQQGKCHAGSRCHQIHVDRDYITALRSQNAGKVTCCYGCGDQEAYGPAVSVLNVVGLSFSDLEDAEDVVVPISRVGRTAGFEGLLHNCVMLERPSGRVLSIPFAKVCRLHRKGMCKYGRDCKNVHVCRHASVPAGKINNTNSTSVATSPVPLSRAYPIANMSPRLKPKPQPLSADATTAPTEVALPIVAAAPTLMPSAFPSEAMKTPTTRMLSQFCAMWNHHSQSCGASSTLTNGGAAAVPDSPLVSLPSPLVQLIGAI